MQEMVQASIDSAHTVRSQSDDQGKLNLDWCPLDIPFCHYIYAPKITIGHAQAAELLLHRKIYTHPNEVVLLL